MANKRSLMADIMTAADAVAEDLLDSPEYQDIETTRRLLGEDDETRELLWNYQAAKKTIHDAREQGHIVTDKILKDSKDLKKALAADPNFQAYKRAKQTFENLLRDVTRKLSELLGGIEFAELALSAND